MSPAPAELEEMYRKGLRERPDNLQYTRWEREAKEKAAQRRKKKKEGTK